MGYNLPVGLHQAAGHLLTTSHDVSSRLVNFTKPIGGFPKIGYHNIVP